MPNILDEFKQRRRFIENINYKEAAARLSGFLAWLDSKEEIAPILKQLENPEIAKKILEKTGWHVPPQASTAEEICYVGLYFLREIKVKVKDTWGIGNSYGLFNGNEKIQDVHDKVMYQYIDPAIDEIENKLIETFERGVAEMSFASMMRDKVAILKKDGTKVDDLKASIQGNKIFMDTSNIVDTGDLIQRFMSNGVEETYQVIDPRYYEKGGAIPAHYEIEVKKLGIPEAKQAVQSITENFMFIDKVVNSPIQQGTSQSHQTVNYFQNDLDKISKFIVELRSKLPELEISDRAKAELEADISTVESQLKSPQPKSGIIRESLLSMITILEGAAGGILSSGLLQLLAQFL